MKVRIKFSKVGPMKFVGHLDTMRYFQKAIRRAGLPAAFSGGFSPHMIMSFASPLGVGIESLGEYFDLELAEEENSPLDLYALRERLQAAMVEDINVLAMVRIPEGKAQNAMSLVAAADYEIRFRPGRAMKGDISGKMGAFLKEKEIWITKEGKNGERQVDIRPYIYEMEERGEAIFCRLASASGNYTRPEDMMRSFIRFAGQDGEDVSFTICRLEVYADRGDGETHDFVPLYALGEDEGVKAYREEGREETSVLPGHKSENEEPEDNARAGGALSGCEDEAL